jgi:hypothetical protein
MSELASLIMIQFLSWVADRPRSYAQTMEAWRTSCPRLSVWEDAVIQNLVRIDGNGGRAVRLTERGFAVLQKAKDDAGAALSNSTPRARRSGAIRTTRRRRAAAESRMY